MSSPLLHVTVPGLPQPQGSARAFVNRRTGRAIVTSDNPKLHDWRHRLALGIAASRVGTGPRAPYDGAVRVHLRFHLPRPKSAPKRVVYPTKKPDCDKLARGANDSLVDAGVIRDDAQIVEIQATKCYAVQHPGVEILVWPMEGA